MALRTAHHGARDVEQQKAGYEARTGIGDWPGRKGEARQRFDAWPDGTLEGVRVGVERANHFPEDGDPAVAERFEAAVERLAALGATVTEVVLPHHAETLTAILREDPPELSGPGRGTFGSLDRHA